MRKRTQVKIKAAEPAREGTEEKAEGEEGVKEEKTSEISPGNHPLCSKRKVMAAESTPCSPRNRKNFFRLRET